MKIAKTTGKVTQVARKVLNCKLKYCGAVIVAAGSASRMGGIDKVMAELGGEPMIVRTVRAFQNCDAIREIVVVTRPDLMQRIMGLCRDFSKVTAIVAGGKDRPESVELGLNALSAKVKLAAIQDGARPLITDAVIANPAAVQLAQKLALAPDQLGMKAGMLVGTLFPLFAIGVYLYYVKSKKNASNA